MNFLPWDTETQNKNLAWVLPRPNDNRYKGGMPLHCERWLITLARYMLGETDIDVLTLFSGGSKCGLRVDILPDVKPDIVADAHNLPLDTRFDLVIADPPYSDKESKELYGTGRIRYKDWVSEADRLVRDDGLLLVYHKYIMPNPNPTKYRVRKRVFIGGRVYHSPRVATYFRKDG